MEKQCEGIGQPVSVDLQVKLLFYYLLVISVLLNYCIYCFIINNTF